MEFVGKDYTLLVTIVNSDGGSRVMQTASELGSRYNIILRSRGTVQAKLMRLLGIDSLERETVLTLFGRRLDEDTLSSFVERLQLDKPGNGITFVLSVGKVMSCMGNYRAEGSALPRPDSGDGELLFDLVMSIVSRGYSEDVVDAARGAGAEGGTIINARGTGIHETTQFFGISIEPEKEIILNLVLRDKTRRVVDAIVKATRMESPGRGIAMVLPVDRALGIAHLKK